MQEREIMVYGWVEPKYSEYKFTLVTDTYDSDKSLRLVGKVYYPNSHVPYFLEAKDKTKNYYKKIIKQ